MPSFIDGPVSPRFTPLPLAGNAVLAALPPQVVSAGMRAAAGQAPQGRCVGWGMPFDIGRVVLVAGEAVELAWEAVAAPWLVFAHTSDTRPYRDARGESLRPLSGMGRLGEHAADYVFRYADGDEVRVPIRRRFQVGLYGEYSGDLCFEATHMFKACPVRPFSEQPGMDWLGGEMRIKPLDPSGWSNWLWAWENPRPAVPLVGLRLEPVSGVLLLSAITAGQVDSFPLRWGTRKKALLTLPEGVAFAPTLTPEGLLAQIRLDLGQVISATPRRCYAHAD